MRDFEMFGLSERGIFLLNELYAIGGKNTVDMYKWFEAIKLFPSLKIYFMSLAAIVFQFNALAGIFLAVGLLISSRIAFTLSLLGFYTAYWFYQFIGVDFNELNYTFIGYNYILTAIAAGGFFLIPSRSTYFWVLILLPITIIITFGLSKIFAVLQIPIYSLPFNIVVLLFLYILKLRPVKGKYLVEPVFQQNSPEKNLYLHQSNINRFPDPFYFPVYLPFLGEWNVSQGHKGEYTHQGEWGHAWDFVICDSDGKQFRNNGDYCKDYYCYEKPISAPTDGVVVEIVDGIEDNIIGDINTFNNWGNSIIIKHTEYLFSQMSHLKSNSFKVRKGDFVRKNEIVALCGNSGRSPYPHLHFQLQATPFIGSKTLDYAIAHYISVNSTNYELKSFDKPQQNEIISNINKDELLDRALHFIPGQTIKYRITRSKASGKCEYFVEWDVLTDVYNNTFIQCKTSKSKAYLRNDGVLHYFTNFVGSRKSPLYYFFLSLYKVETGFYEGLLVEDQIQTNKIFKSGYLFVQDFIAPFFTFLNAGYSMKYLESDDDFSPSEILIKSRIEMKILKRIVNSFQSEITINKQGISKIKIIKGLFKKKSIEFDLC
jgi:murein DD-endopeptidase MepM/ murein hydrolase activator NlpD